MNWRYLRPFPWLDTRARFVAATPRGGTLLDLGSSDGETLGHIAELRPDLRLFAADQAGQPDRYPRGCAFARVDLEKQPLPWPDGSMDTLTCLHLVEHLHDLSLLFREVARLLKPGGRVYFETPHPKSLHLPSLRANVGGPFARRARPRPSSLSSCSRQDRESRTRTRDEDEDDFPGQGVPPPPQGKLPSFEFTLNFHDDPTHVRIVPVAELAEGLRGAGLEICARGISRNWLFAAAHPVFQFRPPSRKKYTAQVHWLGWSACLTARRPAQGGTP